MQKSTSKKHGTPVWTYKVLKKEFCSTNNVEHKFWFFPFDIKYYVGGNRKIHFGLAYSTHHMAGEVRYQYLEGGGVGARRRQPGSDCSKGRPFLLPQTSHFFNNCNTLDPLVAFFVPPILQTRPSSRFSRTMRCNPTATTTDYKNKWKSAKFSDFYHDNSDNLACLKCIQLFLW